MIDINDSKKVSEIIKDYKSSSNKDLMFALDFLQKDFNFTKERIIELTNHLDKLEVLYNKVLSEYQNRTKTK
jgi:hypothetical protein